MTCCLNFERFLSNNLRNHSDFLDPDPRVYYIFLSSEFQYGQPSDTWGQDIDYCTLMQIEIAFKKHTVKCFGSSSFGISSQNSCSSLRQE